MIWVLIAIVVGNVILQAVTTHDLTERLTQREQQMTDAQHNIVRSLVVELETSRRAETERLRHQDDLQHDITTRELEARTQERIASMQQPIAPFPGMMAPPIVDSGMDYNDPDPTQVGPLIDRMPDYGEQLDGGYVIQEGREKAVMVPPGGSLIPGSGE